MTQLTYTVGCPVGPGAQISDDTRVRHQPKEQQVVRSPMPQREVSEKHTVRSITLIISLKAVQRIFLRGRFLHTRGARSFLSHLVSDPHAQNTFRAWLSACLRIPRLADGAVESLKRVLGIVLRIIYGAVALDQELSSRYVECVRNSAEITSLGVFAPVFEAPGACQARNEFR